MEELARHLREARTSLGMTLEATSGAAKISPAYLHKLEAGRVQTPSPHVLRRLAAALEVPYPTLMTLADYLERSESAADSEEARHGTPGRKAKAMKRPTTGEEPTNAEIVRLLQALQAELGELRRGQEELTKKLAQPAPRKTRG